MTHIPSISISHLSKKYLANDNHALKDLSLEIQKGEIFGILGPNGAGKTTLFSILCGILPSTKGEVDICGYSLKKNLSTIKQLFGIVPQDIALYPALSGKNNLMYIGRMYGMRGKELKNRVDRYLSLFGLEENRNQFVKHYSGGMKRRINLIGGLLHKPEVVLLDEPTVGVDVQTRNSIMGHLKTVNEMEQTTILYTSHYMEQAQMFCDRVGILENGKLLRMGTPKELITEEGVENLEEVFLKLTGNPLTT
ncbi:UNVERIFIED_CONTAM: hypothetical protein GTU68_046387 [Idotea baltica]|nr:hypothetical protein [Idotea baltica]